MKSNFKIAILLTCHNRRDTTLLCLEALFQAALKPKYKLDVYLVDDGSTDGTREAVNNSFSEVHVIQGDGSLFWNQGMRLAWDTASRKSDYDFYLWLNDDTIIREDALLEILACYEEALFKDGKPPIIAGACQMAPDNDQFSYGGRLDSGSVVPNGELQVCKYINGNVVLVSKPIYEQLGNLSPEYTHGMGDFDYGLRAAASGFKCYTTKRFIAVCPRDSGTMSWYNPGTPFLKRWELLHSPKGLNLKEYTIFRKKFWGRAWMIFAIKAYMRVLLPRFYSKISNRT